MTPTTNIETAIDGILTPVIDLFRADESENKPLKFLVLGTSLDETLSLNQMLHDGVAYVDPKSEGLTMKLDVDGMGVSAEGTIEASELTEVRGQSYIGCITTQAIHDRMTPEAKYALQASLTSWNAKFERAADYSLILANEIPASE